MSIMVLEEGSGKFQLRYAFSTDKPTVCVKFSLGGESVFVVTDKIYQISLEDFQARNLSEKNRVLHNTCIFCDHAQVTFQLMNFVISAWSLVSKFRHESGRYSVVTSPIWPFSCSFKLWILRYSVKVKLWLCKR